MFWIGQHALSCKNSSDLGWEELWFLECFFWGQAVELKSSAAKSCVSLHVKHVQIFCSKGKTGITWQFWSVAYARRGSYFTVQLRLVAVRQALLFSIILENFCLCKNVGDLLTRLWFRPGCRGGGCVAVSPALPGQLWGVTSSYAELPFCPQPLEPDVTLHIHSQFIVGFHWFWLQQSIQWGLRC